MELLPNVDVIFKTNALLLKFILTTNKGKAFFPMVNCLDHHVLLLCLNLSDGQNIANTNDIFLPFAF